MYTTGDSIRVLHVDDDPDFRELAATFLEREDERFAVETAASAAEARERLADGTFDCVVSDYEMPETDGIALLEDVREEYPDLPFILFTGRGSEAVAGRAISAGVTDYLQKESGTDQYAVLANRIDNAVEHHRSRRLAERSETRLREIIDSLPHLLFVVDADGVYRLANQALASFHGLSVDALEGSAVGDVLGEQLAAEVRADVEDVLESEAEKQLSEVEIPDADGETHVLEPRLLPCELAGTGERAVLGISVDVTERRERERELERTNALLSTLFDTLPVGVLAEDEQRNVLAANETLLELFGLPGGPDELVGADCERLARETSELFADPEAFVRGTDELVASQTPVRDEELRLDDGRTFARSHQPIELAGDRGHLWVYRDITARREHARQLEALNETTRKLLVAETRQAVADIGVEAAREVLGLEANTLYVRDETAGGLVPVASTDAVSELVDDPPTLAEGESIAWRAFESGEAFAVDDVRDVPDVYNPDSAVRSELYLPVGDAGVLVAGATTEAVFTEGDIAVGEILAGSIAAALEQVEHAEQVRTREAELRRQNERLEQFVSVVSHDLRNPLSVAAGRLELAREDCESEQFDRIETALDRMDDLIEDLLTLARGGDEVREMEPVELAALSRRCWRTVETDGATLEVETERSVLADRNRLKQLFENLIGNSVEHGSTSSRTGSGDAVEHGSTSNRAQPDDTVEHGSPDVTVTVGDLPDGFYVEDDGPGIPESEREDVFEAGYSTSEEGTGFGLSIVKEVADAHGWEIRVTEGTDGGARFEITGVDRPE